MTLDRARLYRFHIWLANPVGGAIALKLVLDQLRDVELQHLMTGDNPQAATIAWAEYGRRRKFANIDYTTEGVDVVKVGITDLVFASVLAAA